MADPRPPTVSLTAEIAGDHTLTPGGTLPLRIATSTLTGVPLGGARVRLAWTLSRAPPPLGRGRIVPFDGGDGGDGGYGEEELPRGEEYLVTKDDGVLSVDWRPKDLPADGARYVFSSLRCMRPSPYSFIL